ncbi:hypothetical protein NECAME_08140 [Necator americanus]|uniref:Uncharacterized protein n=1 Tax=Necator americanus TaxID=51031 RepID=W2TKJ7_NECAM|nr:hypothetical protein NECAME_08140 [Necator americanus]ETN82149.1 hypothetical protein NECAME_08140 [Necator americanus]
MGVVLHYPEETYHQPGCFQLAIVMSLVMCVFLYILLGYAYFNSIEVNCPWCRYFNCINIEFITGSNHFCDNTGQKLSQWLPI